MQANAEDARRVRAAEHLELADEKKIKKYFFRERNRCKIKDERIIVRRTNTNLLDKYCNRPNIFRKQFRPKMAQQKL